MYLCNKYRIRSSWVPNYGRGGGKGEDSTQTPPPWRGLKLAYLHSTHIDELRILLAYSDIWIFCQ